MDAMISPPIAAPTKKARKPGRRNKTGLNLLRSLTALIICCIFLLPFLWLVGSSFKTQFSIFSDVDHLSIWTFIPRHPTMANFTYLFTHKGVGRALINSFLVACGQVIGTILLCTTCAYGLTRIKFRGSGPLFLFLLITFLVPGDILVVPMYRIATQLHLSNTLWAIFLPWIASPFGLFLLRQAYEDVPHELDEAATIDGANHWQVFTRIILPNVKTSITTLAIVTFLFSWNAFLWPLVVIQSTSKEVIQVSIAQSVVPGELPNWGTTFAGATVAVIPVLLLFVLLQRHVVEGMASTGLKG